MAIQHIIDVKTKNLGAIEVRRVLPASKQKMVGPWIFF